VYTSEVLLGLPLVEEILLRRAHGPGMVVLTCNLSYLGGRSRLLTGLHGNPVSKKIKKIVGFIRFIFSYIIN
jgi:hypothetical protein